MANPVQVQSLDHVTLVVKDLEQSRRFYVDGLGMRRYGSILGMNKNVSPLHPPHNAIGQLDPFEMRSYQPHPCSMTRG